MKKIGTVLLNIILFGVLLLFAGSISVSKIATHTITQQITGMIESQRMIDIVMNVFPNADTDQLLQVQNAMKDSPAIEGITEKYISEITKAAALGQQLELPNIKDDTDTLLEENMSIIEKGLGTKITENQKQDIKEKLEEKSDDVQYALDSATQSLAGETSGSKVILFKTYYVVTSIGFQAACMAGIVILIALISLLKKSLIKAFFSEGIAFLAAGVSLIAFLPAMTQRIGGEIASRILGSYMNIDFSGLKLAGAVMLAVGFIMEVSYWLTLYRKVSF